MTKRKMMVGEEKWWYQIGRQNVVDWTPSGEKNIVSFDQFLGADEVRRRAAERKQYLAERWEENNYSGFAITPQDVRNFIDDPNSWFRKTSPAVVGSKKSC